MQTNYKMSNNKNIGSIKLVDIHTDNLFTSIMVSEMNGKLKDELHKMLWVKLHEIYQLGYRRGGKDVGGSSTGNGNFKSKQEWKDSELAKTYEEMKAKFDRLDELEEDIGELPEGAHPDERKPRAETWLQERANWQIEVEMLRNKIKEQELIIHGIEEGSESWKAEYDNCRAVLVELVVLKKNKDRYGKTEEYLTRQPLAWETAKSFLSKYQH